MTLLWGIDAVNNSETTVTVEKRCFPLINPGFIDILAVMKSLNLSHTLWQKVRLYLVKSHNLEMLQ